MYESERTNVRACAIGERCGSASDVGAGAMELPAFDAIARLFALDPRVRERDLFGRGHADLIDLPLRWRCVGSDARTQNLLAAGSSRTSGSSTADEHQQSLKQSWNQARYRTTNHEPG